MFVLRDTNDPEVTQALLRQLNDRRPTVEPMGITEIVKPQALRVCDAAFNTLAGNLGVRDSPRTSMFIGNARRDEIIQEGLAESNLTPR